MGVFSRYKAVLESDDSPMSVKTALQLINRELDEYLGGIQGEFDADTRFAITWFEQNGMARVITVSLTTLPAPAVFLSIASSTRASSKALRVRSASFRAMNSTTIGTRKTTTT
jgi:hypothetical protein